MIASLSLLAAACAGLGIYALVLARRLKHETGEREAIEQRFKAALAVNPTVVFTLDTKLRYSWVYNNQVGAADHRAIGRTPFDFFEADSAQQLHDFFAEVLDQQAPLRRELRLTAINGLCRHFISAARPIFDEDGRLAGITGASIDISEVIERERALAAARTLADEARVEAERANRAKSTFLAAASHDLRQPFQAMRLFHQVLEGKAPPELTGIIEHLGKAMASGEELLNAILDLSVLDSGNVQPKPATFPINEVLEEITGECSGVAEAAGLRLRRVACSAKVTTDRVLLKRMVRNLVMNAIRYTRHGGIVLGCRRRAEGLEIQVADTGMGIPEDTLTHIFDDFYQVGNASRDRGHGLGLGLAIVDRLSRLLGLLVSVRSIPGRGTSFRILLP